jgi:hypothetical protein
MPLDDDLTSLALKSNLINRMANEYLEKYMMAEKDIPHTHVKFAYIDGIVQGYLAAREEIKILPFWQRVKFSLGL